MGYHSVVSSVALLLFPGCPRAIVGIVAILVVNPFEGMLFRWALPYVGYEILELLPPITYRNSALSVVVIVLVIWIMASTQHVTPRCVLGSIAAAVSDAFSTAAACRVLHSKMVAIDNRCAAAVTRTEPLKSVIPLPCFFDYGENSIAVPDFVFLSCHRSPFIGYFT